MRIIHKILKGGIFILVFGMAISACDKVDDNPPLGNYPKDSNPPGGPIKFYAAYDGINADSIRAVFANTDSMVTYVGGASGQAAQFNPVLGANGTDSVFSFLVYPNANDFATVATSFTISFWLKIPLSKKDNVNADGILALASTINFWGNVTVYADHTTGGNSDSMDLKFHFANGPGDNWDFANYVGAARWPHMYDDQWHQVVFSYDAPSLTATLYRDGVQFDKRTNETIVFDGNASSLIVGGFQEAAGIKDTYSNNGWMSGFPGAIDNVKFIGEALSAQDVATNYANKD